MFTPSDKNQQLFAALAAKREIRAETFTDPAFSGIAEQFKDLNTARANVVYELLQNADDKGADRVRIELRPDGLLFAHNAPTGFSISSVATEGVDIPLRQHGSVNAICGIGASDKSAAGNVQIGKFGIGFKTVFAYTRCPHVYDRQFSFRIEQFVVPQLLTTADAMGALRQPDETLFWMPFEAQSDADIAVALRSIINPAQAFKELSEKLSDLECPLLFLPTLRAIRVTIINELGTKRIHKYTRQDEAQPSGAAVDTVRLTTLSHRGGVSERWLVFERPVSTEPTRQLAIAYAVGAEGIIQPTNAEVPTIFCYFRTQQKSGLKFLVHAPWMLTMNRANVRNDEDLNFQLVEEIAALAAESLMWLRDTPPIGATAGSLLMDSLLDWLPTDSKSVENTDGNITFRPVYEAMLSALKTQRLLPTVEGSHVTAKEAYWADQTGLSELFGNGQLRDATGDGTATWVFTSVARNPSQNQRVTADYIRRVLVDPNKRWLTPEKVVTQLGNVGFWQQPGQDDAWLTRFYQYVQDDNPKLLQGPLRDKPFLRLEGDGTPHSTPFDKAGNPLVFLPLANLTSGVAVLKACFAADPALATFRDLLHLSAPSLLDTVRLHWLPQYKHDENGEWQGPSTDEHLAQWPLVVKCWRESPEAARQKLEAQLRELPVISCIDSEEVASWHVPTAAYLSSPSLQAYFAVVPTTNFVDDALYSRLQDTDAADLRAFWLAIGVAVQPRAVHEWRWCTLAAWPPTEQRRQVIGRMHSPSEEWYRCWEVEGVVENLTAGATIEPAMATAILRVLSTQWNNAEAESSLFTFEYCYKYYREYYHELPVETLLYTALSTSAWLYTTNGTSHCPAQFPGTLDDLHPHYDLTQPGARDLLRELGIKEPENSALAGLTDEQREQLEKGRLMEAFSLAELQELKADKARRQAAEKAAATPPATTYTPTPLPLPPPPAKPAPPTRPTVDVPLPPVRERLQAEDYDDRIKAIKASADKEQKDSRERAEREVALTEQLAQSAPYSYGWCQHLLAWKAQLTRREGRSNAQTLSVTLRHAAYATDARQPKELRLTDEDRAIWDRLFDLDRSADWKLQLTYPTTGAGHRTNPFGVEGMTQREGALWVRLDEAVAETDLAAVVSARLFTTGSVDFLDEELARHFGELAATRGFTPATDLQAALPAQVPPLEFIFGPPGTGKTTYLTEQIIWPRLRADQPPARILVLTPTNKAADVLTRRLMAAAGQDQQPAPADYASWLVRFGTSTDAAVEAANLVVAGPDLDLDDRPRRVVVSTIARFPYATWGPQGQRLADVPWDFVVLDEASMISLVPALNVLYHLPAATCQRVFVGGDPQQIPPVESMPELADENLYTLVGLRRFNQLVTDQHQYPVHRLLTQYRATAPLGEVFNQFAYDGQIERHARARTARTPLALSGSTPLADLTVVRFPVKAGESIYKARRLNTGSTYHPHSALLTAALVQHLTRQMLPTERALSIGVVTPYRAQADLVRAILKQQTPATQLNLPAEVGTVHGFQGDECDIIIVLLNPPEHLSVNCFLNRQHLLNVAFSRARDYVIVLAPEVRNKEEGTKNYDTLSNLIDLIGRMREQIAVHGKDVYVEYPALELERVIFPGATEQQSYLLANTFMADHQTVNVYAQPVYKFELRHSDTAVDVQIEQ